MLMFDQGVIEFYLLLLSLIELTDSSVGVGGEVCFLVFDTEHYYRPLAYPPTHLQHKTELSCSREM